MVTAETSPSGKGRRSSNFATAAPVVLHDTQLAFPITMVHANFDDAAGARAQNSLIASHHNEEARLMNIVSGKADRAWSTWNDAFFRRRFEELYPDHEMWGHGSGQMIGNPNPVAISRPYGVVVGEGCPEGRVSFHAAAENAQQFLQNTSWTSAASTTLGMPSVPTNREGISSVWVARSSTIPSLSNGMVGILSGSSLGIVSAYSLGHVGMRDKSITRGELTARWVLSPGVPVTSIVVDEHYSLKRQAQNRIWAIALNALGEVFYLTKFPKRLPLEKRPNNPEKGERVERLAWLSARSVNWNMVEPSRRTSVPDPYGDQTQDGSYSPRSSWDGMCLSDDQVQAETAEMAKFLRRRPMEFRQDCIGWDMQRKIEVDFAGDDGNFAGEAILVVTNPAPTDIKSDAGAKRYMRVKSSKILGGGGSQANSEPVTPRAVSPVPASHESIFGPDPVSSRPESSSDMSKNVIASLNIIAPFEEWWASDFKYKTHLQITCTTMDCSRIANLTLSEDPIITANGNSANSSGSSSPTGTYDTVPNVGSIPGQRARFVAVGTSMGFIYIWNMRAPRPRSQGYTHIVEPVRIIDAGMRNNSGVTCLAMNSLIIVHGDNDGLVQAWDPLASQTQPIRTISSPFTGRVRRKVLEAEATSDHDHSLFSAGAIVLDPDSTILRGIVAIGTHIKHWQFRADDVNALGSRGNKRRRRKEARGINSSSGTPTGMTSRGGIAGFIEDEVRDLTAERKRENKERQRLQQRFGVGMLGEEEELQLAILLSEEAFDVESQSERSTPRLAAATAATIPNDESVDPDIAEAIRRSLQESSIDSSPMVMTPLSPSPSPPVWGGPIRFSTRGRRSPGSSSPKADAGSSGADEASDLELALMLSMADQDRSGIIDDFPSLGSDHGKGKRSS
jgi:hypothetical protein